MARSNGHAVTQSLLAKLAHFTILSKRDIHTLTASFGAVERFAARQTIVAEGDIPRSAFVMVRGMAIRYRDLADGRRQILSFLMPGDLLNLSAFLLKTMPYSVETLLPTTVAVIDRASVRALLIDHPRLSAALLWSALQEEAILHERIVGLGRRNATRRVAFLLCELVCRQRAIGLSDDHSIRLPLTQADLGDAAGLTSVHVNRVLQSLRKAKLIQLDHGRLKLLDYQRVADLAEFTGSYLQLGGIPADAARYLTELEATNTAALKAVENEIRA